MNSSDRQFKKMTETPVEKLILMLSVPTIISMLVTNIYNLVDTAFVGTLGDSASGAVGIVFGFMSIIQAIGFLFGQGSGSILARKLGHRDIESASKTASTGFFVSLSFGTIASIICAVFLDELVMFLGSTETIAPYAIKYITFILITAPLMAAGFTLNNILRYEGRAFFGMIALLSGAIMNIGGDMLFMFVFDMGIAGAGLSTAISQLISFVFLLLPFLMKKTQCRISIRNVDLSIKHLGDIVLTGLPSLLRQGLNSIATILLNSLSGVYGDAAVAAMSIVSRVYFFIFAICLGVGQGFQPVSSFNYGAEKFARVRKAYKFTVILSTCIIIVLGTGVALNAGPIIRIFRDSDQVVEFGTRALVLQAITGFAMPFCTSTEMLLQSTGKKLWASIVSALRSGIIFIPTLWILATVRGMAGIQEAQPAAFLLGAVTTAFFAFFYMKQLPTEDRDRSL